MHEGKKKETEKRQKREVETIQLKIPENLQSELVSRLEEKQNKQLADFNEAWKNESGLGLLLIEKLSIIVSKYFTMGPQLKKRNEEIDLLITYNKALLDILYKFEDHERKILNKLHKLEEMNISCMRDIHIAKGKEFKMPNYKPEKSIFENFSLTNLKFQQKQAIHQEEIDLFYKEKLLELFRKHLLESNEPYEGKVRELIRKYEKEEKTLSRQDDIENLQNLIQSIKSYNNALKHVNFDNMFELFQMKVQIKEEMKNLDLSYCLKSLEEEEQQQVFVRNVMKLQASLQKMEENTLQKYLKEEKMVRRRFKKKRIKEQEQFERRYEKMDSENVDLKSDIKLLREKINLLEKQLSQAKIELDVKSMKHSISKVHGSVLNESEASVFDPAGGRERKKHLKQNIKMLEFQLRQWKKKCQELEKKLKDVNIDENEEMRRRVIINQLKFNQIAVNQSLRTIQILQLVTERLIEEQKRETEQNDSMNIVSPSCDRGIFTLDHFDLKPIPEQHEGEEHELKMKELEKQKKEMKYQLLKLKDEVDNKEKVIQECYEKFRLQEQDQRENVKKLNSLVLEYESMKTENSKQREKSKYLEKKVELVESLSKNLIETIKHLTKVQMKPEIFSATADLTIKKIKAYAKKYKKDLQKVKEAAENWVIEEEGKIKLNNFDSFIDTSFSVIKNLRDVERSGSFSKKRSRDLNDSEFKLENSSLINKTVNDKNSFQKDEKLAKSTSKSKNIPRSPSLNENIKKEGRFLMQRKDSETSAVKIKVDDRQKFQEEFGEKEEEIFSPNSPNEGKSRNSQGSLRDKEFVDYTSKNLSQPPQIDAQDSFMSKYGEEEDTGEKKDGNRLKRDLKSYEKNKLRSQTQYRQEDNYKKTERFERHSFMKDDGMKSKKQKEIGKEKKEQDQLILKMINSVKSKEESKFLDSQKPSSYEKSISKSEISAPEIRILQAHENEEFSDSSKKLLKQEVNIEEKKNKQVSKMSNEENEKKGKQFSSISEIESLNKKEVELEIQSNDGSSKKRQRNRIKHEDSEESGRHENSLSLSLSKEGATELKRFSKNNKFQQKRNFLIQEEMDDLSNDDFRVRQELDFVELMYKKIQKLKNNPDTLDFYELYQRYKQALKCLEKEEKLNKINELKYQKFLKILYQEQQNGDFDQYDLKQQIYDLKKHVYELKTALQQERLQFEQTLENQVRQSKQTIRQHLKLMNQSNPFPDDQYKMSRRNFC